MFPSSFLSVLNYQFRLAQKAVRGGPVLFYSDKTQYSPIKRKAYSFQLDTTTLSYQPSPHLRCHTRATEKHTNHPLVSCHFCDSNVTRTGISKNSNMTGLDTWLNDFRQPFPLSHGLFSFFLCYIKRNNS